MADITMCQDNKCENKTRCYRFTAVPNQHWQPYYMMSPRTYKGCTEFWDNKEVDTDGQNSSTL